LDAVGAPQGEVESPSPHFVILRERSEPKDLLIEPQRPFDCVQGDKPSRVILRECNDPKVLLAVWHPWF